MQTLAHNLFSQYKQTTPQADDCKASSEYHLSKATSAQFREYLRQIEVTHPLEVVTHKDMTLFISTSRLVAGVSKAGFDINGQALPNQYFIERKEITAPLGVLVKLKFNRSINKLRKISFQALVQMPKMCLRRTNALSKNIGNTKNIEWHTVRLTSGSA